MSLSKWIQVAIVVSLSASAQAPAQPPSHPPSQPCLSDMPDTLRAALEQDNWKIVQREDLSVSDLRAWKDRHPGDCPGVASGNFSPRVKQSFIVALIQRDTQNNLTEKVLLAAMKKNKPESEFAITTMSIATPYVVWKLPKGHYLGIEGTKASISRNSFVYEKLIGPASQYYYDGSHLKSFVISR
ncbi:MAG: hypothetical protein ABI072_03335 [Edaphobacter sp.]